MSRQNLGEGRWFETTKADCYGESRHFDGNNMISNATGSQWAHQELYCTAKGTWVLHSWSQWQGSSETWEVISKENAFDWMISQGHTDDVPEEYLSKKEV